MIELLIAHDSLHKAQVGKLYGFRNINLKFISLIKAKHAGLLRLDTVREPRSIVRAEFHLPLSFLMPLL